MPVPKTNPRQVIYCLSTQHLSSVFNTVAVHTLNSNIKSTQQFLAAKRQQWSVKNPRRLRPNLHGVALKSWQHRAHLLKITSWCLWSLSAWHKNILLNIYISHSLGQLKNVGLQFSTVQRGCEECYSKALIASYFPCSLIYCVVVFILVVFLMLPMLNWVSLKQHEPGFIFLAKKPKVN